MSIFRFLQRNTQPTLYQSYQDYLNQALPDISGIFASTPAQAMEETTEETVAQPVGLTPEQLALLYPQQNQGGEGIQSLDVQDFQDAITARQERIANPDPIAKVIISTFSVDIPRQSLICRF